MQNRTQQYGTDTEFHNVFLVSTEMKYWTK